MNELPAFHVNADLVVVIRAARTLRPHLRDSASGNIAGAKIRDVVLVADRTPV
jgi:hypothetical protein